MTDHGGSGLMVPGWPDHRFVWPGRPDRDGLARHISDLRQYMYRYQIEWRKALELPVNGAGER
jgi:hypothetical protein